MRRVTQVCEINNLFISAYYARTGSMHLTIPCDDTREVHLLNTIVTNYYDQFVSAYLVRAFGEAPSSEGTSVYFCNLVTEIRKINHDEYDNLELKTHQTITMRIQLQFLK